MINHQRDKRILREIIVAKRVGTVFSDITNNTALRKHCFEGREPEV
jgi:hypothetical protein